MILPDVLSHSLIFIGLFLGTLTDFDRREVPDYLNYGLLIIGLGGAAIVSVLQGSIWPFVSSIAGVAFGYLVGAMMFYTGQWGGGDAKMLMAMGSITGIGLETWGKGLFLGEMPILLTITITIFLAGAIYGLGFTIYIIIKNWKRFRRGFLKRIRTPQMLRIRKLIIGLCIIGFVGIVFTENPLLKAGSIVLAFGSFFGMYAFIVARTIENVCMIQEMKVSDLTEGEWIYKDVFVKGERICGRKDLGVTNEQIEKLEQYKIQTVTVKIGIPFIPGFLLGYIAIIIWGNWLTTYLPTVF